MSLAQQLRKLQIPGQSVIQQLTSQHASLLFDSRTASSLDNESIRNIGLQGFNELLQIDPVFSQFEQLFSTSSLHFQRNLEDGTVNKKIKRKIRDYLLFLTPYLLLKPAQKTLEWLVRRFQCHIWDKEALIACILPFHESQIFGRIIQLFGTRAQNDSWDWLLTCQKDGCGFSTSSLVNHCVTNRMLLSFVCKMADNCKGLISQHPKSGLKIVFSFYARLLTSVVDAMVPINEDFVSFLLPFLHSGLKSKLRDYICSSYMVIACLSSKTKLMKDVTKAVLAVILKSMEKDWYEEGLLCIISVLIHQNVKKLSPRVFGLFIQLNKKQLIEVIVALEKEHDIAIFFDRLIPLLCKSVASDDEMSDKAVDLLKGFIDDLKLNEKQIADICRGVVGGVTLDYSGDLNNEDNIPEHIKEVLNLLATRFPVIFDDSIAFLFQDFGLSEEKKIYLQPLKQVLINCLSSAKHGLNEGSDLPLVLSLNHPQADVRILAVQQLFSTFKSGISLADQQYFIDAVIARLNDDRPDVVSAVLKFPKSIIKLLPGEVLLKFVIKLMKRSDAHYNLNELIVAAIQSLPSANSSDVNEFVYAVFGQLLYAFCGKRNKKLVEALSSADFGTGNVILKGIFNALSNIPIKSLAKEDCEEDVIVSAFSSLVVNIADAILADEHGMNVVEDLWSYRENLSMSHDLQFITLILLTVLLCKSPQLSVRMIEFDFRKYLEKRLIVGKVEDLIMMIDSLETEDDVRRYCFKGYYSYLKSGEVYDVNKLTKETFFIFLKMVVQSFTKSAGTDQSREAMSKQTLFATLSMQAVDKASPYAFLFHHLLNQVLTGTFSSREEVFSFLSGAYMRLTEDNLSDELFTAAVCALHITRRFLSRNAEEIIMKSDCLVVPVHLVLLGSPLPLVREIVLDNINAIHKITLRKRKYLWNYPLSKVIDSKKEIEVDPSQLKRCLLSAFMVKSDTRKSEFGRLLTPKVDKKIKSSEEKMDSLHYITKSIIDFPESLQLCFLEALELVNSKSVIADYICLLKKVMDKPEMNEREIKIVQLILKSIQPEMFDSLEELLPLLFQCFNSVPQIQNKAFKLVTPTFYENMGTSPRSKLIEELMRLLLASKSVVVATEIRVILKSIDLDTDHIRLLLERFCETFDKSYVKDNSSNNEISHVLDEDISKSPLWKTLIELLEVLSCKEIINKPEVLVPAVFNVLERCLQCTSVEYIKQLLLLTLLILTRQDMSKLSEDQFKVELLVRCLHSSTDTQTSQQCLMVLGNAARLYPPRVLHNIMHIFSFMGGTMLRLDNEYSFEIIQKTIDAVIPVLIKKEEDMSSRKRPSSSSADEIITFILQTFVDSIPHCPEHRRHHIIKHLVKLLDPGEYLHVVTILLLKKSVQQHRRKSISEEKNMELSPISLEFCKDFFSSYSVPAQVHSLYRIIAYLNTMDDIKSTKHLKTSEDWLFDVTSQGEKQANIFKYTVVSFAADIFKSEKIEVGYDVHPSQQNHLTQLYLQLVEELLSYAEKLGKSKEEEAVKDKVKFSLHQKITEVISQLYNLLPFDSFVAVVSKLLSNQNQLIRKKSLELLCKKLDALDKLSDHQENSLIGLLNTIITLVKYKEEENEETVNKQLMLYAVKLLAKRLCLSQKEPFLKAAPIVAQIYTVPNSNPMLSVNAMLCVAELCSLLKSDILPYLPIIMQPLFARLSIQGSTEYKKGDLLLSSGITILQTFLKSISEFLSPYVKDLLMNTSLYDAAVKDSSNKVLLQKIKTLKEDLGKLLPPRVLFPAVLSCFDSMMETNKQLTTSVVDVYRFSFKTISKSDANSNYTGDILDITKKIFNVRSILTSFEDRSLIVTLEDLAIQAFTDLVLKLTENTLRPMYLELLNWSTETDELSLRLLTFFRLSVGLSKSLKSLFLLFASHILRKSIEVLQKFNSLNEDFNKDISMDTESSKQLVTSVLDTLSNCFFYSTQGFINKERFESIMQPLIDQMESEIHGDEGYLPFVKDHLSPCIVNFASAVNDPACWKPMNYQILLKTKSDNSQVRLASLVIIQQIYDRLGESYMVLIPETIPFLAEILEDDSIEVEKQCQKVIQQIEEISGESIQKYF